MTADVSSLGSFKRRRLIGAVDHTASIDRTANIAENADEFYDFTPEDYHRVQRPRQQEEKLLKTQKIREAEDAKRRSTITRTVIRVRFPDNRTVEATFELVELPEESCWSAGVTVLLIYCSAEAGDERHVAGFLLGWICSRRNSASYVWCPELMWTNGTMRHLVTIVLVGILFSTL